MAEVRVNVRGGTREWQWFLLMLPIRRQGYECAANMLLHKDTKKEQAIRCTQDLGHDGKHSGYARNGSDYHEWPRHEVELYAGRSRYPGQHRYARH